jgi:hypothetical protein
MFYLRCEKMNEKTIRIKEDTHNMLTDMMPNRGDTFDACIKKLIRNSAELRDLKAKKEMN